MKMTGSTEEADFILFNTCAVREHAEDRAFGNIGALSHLKKKRPDVVIALCGCMAQQEKNVEKIKRAIRRSICCSVRMRCGVFRRCFIAY